MLGLLGFELVPYRELVLGMFNYKKVSDLEKERDRYKVEVLRLRCEVGGLEGLLSVYSHGGVPRGTPPIQRNEYWGQSWKQKT